MTERTAGQRCLRRLMAVAVVGLLAGCGYAGANEDASSLDSQTTPEAMDLLSPVDREAFHSARSALNLAAWNSIEPEWQSCIQDDGFSIPSDIGYEMSPLSNVAAYDFIAPSTIRDQGGAIRILDGSVPKLSAEEAKSAEQCRAHTQAVLSGDEPARASLDETRLKAARTALAIVDSDVSTFPLVYAELDRRVADGQWSVAVECMRAGGVDVPKHASDSPNETLEAVGIPFDGTQSGAELEAMVAGAASRLDAYIECSESFYDDLSIRLKEYRADAVDSHRSAFVQLSSELNQLVVRR